MATVRQSITALYEQSQKSVGEGPAMTAVIESEATVPGEAEFAIPAIDEKPSIARRFDDLKLLAEREVTGERRLSDQRSGDDSAITLASFGADEPMTAEGPSVVSVEEEEIEREVSAHELYTGPTGVAADSDMSSIDNAPADIPLPDISASDLPSPDLVLPSEPPAPATGDALSDLDVADIQELVRQAWDDEAAVGRPARQFDDEEPADRPGIEDHADDDPDIEAAMDEIAAAVVQSGEAAMPDMATMRAELVDAMRAELQALLASDIRPMIKSAIAEALLEQPTPEATSGAGTITSGTVAKKTVAKKATSRKKASKDGVARGKAAKKRTSKEAKATRAKTAASAKKSDD